MPTAPSSSSLLHASRPPPVPVVLRGPDKDSRRYITELPRTLDGLLLKARSLFPVPPGNTPYITLDTDAANSAEQTVILEDAIPFIREREVLVFRWSPETPRKCSGHRVKWDASVAPTPAPSSTSPPSRRLPFSQVHSGQAPRPTPTQLHRAAHIKRVLEEQRRQRDVEQAEAEEQQRRSEATEAEEQQELEHQGEQEERQAPQAQDRKDEPTATEQEPHQSDQDTHSSVDGSPAKDDSKEPTATSTATDVALPAPREAVFTASSMTTADLELSGSSPPPYSSPHGPPPVASTAATEPPTAPSLTTAPRFTTPENDTGSDEPPSSPLVSSPTRDVHAAVLKTSMSPHNGDKLVAGRSPGSGGEEAVERDGVAHLAPQPIVECDDAADADSDEELERSALLQSSPPSTTVLRESEDYTSGDTSMESATSVESASSDTATPVVDAKLQHTMKAVIENLKNHPSNNALRDSMPAEFHAFAQDGADDDMQGGSGAIDLHIISARVAAGEYSDGMQHLRRDLRRMWTLTRDFYGPTSAQGRCATVLERFAEVFLNEWKGRSGGAEGAGMTATNKRKTLGSSDSNARQRAAALMASWSQGHNSTSPPPPPRYNKKQRRNGAGAGGNATTPATGSAFKWPDMMAFHRAIMGGDVKIKEKEQEVVQEVVPQPVVEEPAAVGKEQPQEAQEEEHRGDPAFDAGSDLSSAPPSPAAATTGSGTVFSSSSNPSPTASAKRGRRGNGCARGRARKAGGGGVSVQTARRSARGRGSAAAVAAAAAIAVE